MNSCFNQIMSLGRMGTIGFAFFLTVVPVTSVHAATALIFGGEGTENYDPTGTLYSAVRAVQAAGLEPLIVTQRVPHEVLAQAVVWIQPGGPNFYQARDMQRTGVFQQVRDFVEQGGGYVGFCGGGFMAQSSGVLGLGLLPGDAYRQNEATHKTEVLWNGRRRYVHFEHGPRFERHPGVEVFATYASNGAPAAIRGYYGKGKVVVSGPHPEAQDDWAPFEDPDGPDLDLAISMIHSALKE